MIKRNGIVLHPLVLMTGTRYFSYGLNILRGLIIARLLGPYYFGVWGLITLALQYLSFTSLGLENSITVVLSTDRGKSNDNEGKYSSSAIISILTLGTGLLLIAYGLKSSNLVIFKDVNFGRYLLPVVAVAFLSNLQQILTNIYRAKNLLTKIALLEGINSILLLAIVIFSRSQDLIFIILMGMALTYLFSIMGYCWNLPVKLNFRLNAPYIKELVNLGIPLMIYNLSFYLIMTSGRTVLSIFYSIEELGYYTLANSIASATLLGLKTIGWSIYPNVLSQFNSEKDPEQLRNRLNTINKIYSTSVFFLVFMLILLMPILLLFLPQYSDSMPTIIILLFAQAILASSFGFNILAISRYLQRKVAKYSIYVVVLVTILCIITSMLHIEYKFIAICVLVGSILFTYLQMTLGQKILGDEKKQSREFQNIFSIWNIISFCLILIGAFTNVVHIWNISGVAVFILGNFRNIRQVISFIFDQIQE